MNDSPPPPPRLCSGLCSWACAMASTRPTSIRPQRSVCSTRHGKQGFAIVDTARAYGMAEERIGRWMQQRKRAFRIATKISRPNRDAHAQGSISQQFEASLKALGVERVDALLAHRVHDFLDSTTRAEFDRISREGKAASIGASTYNPEDTVSAIEAGADIVQIPASVADWRHAALLQGANSARLIVRSLLLQGALLSQPAKLPAPLASLLPLIEAVGRWAAETADSTCCTAAPRRARWTWRAPVRAGLRHARTDRGGHCRSRRPCSTARRDHPIA